MNKDPFVANTPFFAEAEKVRALGEMIKSPVFQEVLAILREKQPLGVMPFDAGAAYAGSVAGQSVGYNLVLRRLKQLSDEKNCLMYAQIQSEVKDQEKEGKETFDSLDD